MRYKPVVAVLFTAAIWAQQPNPAPAITWDDYQRASNLRTKYQGLVLFDTGAPAWIGTTDQFWYRRSVEGGHEFILVDAAGPAKRPAFDHERLAAALSAAANDKYTTLKLPFSIINFVDNQKAILFDAKGSAWRCELSDYTCRRTGPALQPFGRSAPPPASVSESLE